MYDSFWEEEEISLFEYMLDPIYHDPEFSVENIGIVIDLMRVRCHRKTRPISVNHNSFELELFEKVVHTFSDIEIV